MLSYYNLPYLRLLLLQYHSNADRVNIRILGLYGTSTAAIVIVVI